MRPTFLALLASLALFATSVSLRAGDADWHLFATSKSAKVYFDRASLRTAGDYVHYAVRVELARPRNSKNGKHYYQSALTRIAARCDEGTYATTALTLYGADGAQLIEQRRETAQWRAALKPPRPGGLQARLLAYACARTGREAKAPKRRVKATLGAGVVASRDGAVITNHHVVDGCAAITVLDTKKRRHQAALVGSDLKNDLALLRAKGSFDAVATFRHRLAIQAGEPVTVVGYPLAAVLGTDPNVDFGYVTALAGLRGDNTRFQVTAPVHKGNSGGPVLDQTGRVIGIVTAKLNRRAVEKRTGDLPENIGFAVRGELAQRFLERHKVKVARDAGGPRLENTEVAAIGRAITVLVACRKKP